jgi:zinc transport system substrate-binding protein
MYREQTILPAMILLVSISLVNIACYKDESQNDNRVEVVVTIPPLAEFVEQVGGARVSVTSMVPPGASPHTYEPTPGQMKILSRADLYVKVGTKIEFELVWLDKLITMNETMQVCSASDNIATLRGQEDESMDADPHTWLSVRNASLMAENIYQALSFVDPAHKNEYRTNLNDYHARLDSLDHSIVNMLSNKRERLFIVYHSAWNYFAHDYDLEQVVIEVGSKEPSAKTIQRTIDIARRHNIRIVFASPQFDRKYAEAIAHEINGKVILIDPLSEQYIKNMERIASMMTFYME